MGGRGEGLVVRRRGSRFVYFVKDRVISMHRGPDMMGYM